MRMHVYAYVIDVLALRSPDRLPFYPWYNGTLVPCLLLLVLHQYSVFTLSIDNLCPPPYPWPTSQFYPYLLQDSGRLNPRYE